MSAPEPQGAPRPDPLKSFRGVMAGTLIIEAIVVALALPVVAKLGGGIGSVEGWSIMLIVGALLVLCGLLRHAWATPAVLALQVALIAFFVTLPAVGVIGVLFLGIWGYLLWLRRDVARRLAEGSLPSQQEQV